MAGARQLVGVLVQSLIYLTVKPVTKYVASALINTKLEHLKSQEFQVKNNEKIRVDLISKAILFSTMYNNSILIFFVSVHHILQHWPFSDNHLSGIVQSSWL